MGDERPNGLTLIHIFLLTLCSYAGIRESSITKYRQLLNKFRRNSGNTESYLLLARPLSPRSSRISPTYMKERGW